MSGKRRRGRPKTLYSSNITKWTSVSTERITRETRDRARWRGLIRCPHGRLIITPDGTVKEEVLADICGPLVGKSEHHIQNSGDFVDKDKNLEVPPGRKLIAYDVLVLFTSIPLPDAIKVVRIKLDEDQKLQDRTCQSCGYVAYRRRAETSSIVVARRCHVYMSCRDVTRRRRAETSRVDITWRRRVETSRRDVTCRHRV